MYSHPVFSFVICSSWPTSVFGFFWFGVPDLISYFKWAGFCRWTADRWRAFIHGVCWCVLCEELKTERRRQSAVEWSRVWVIRSTWVQQCKIKAMDGHRPTQLPRSCMLLRQTARTSENPHPWNTKRSRLFQNCCIPQNRRRHDFLLWFVICRKLMLSCLLITEIALT